LPKTLRISFYSSRSKFNAMPFKRYEDVANASSKEELLARLVAFTHHADFERVSVVVQRPKANGGSSYTSLSNHPEALHAIQTDNALAMIDPVHTHLRTSSLPILYTQKTYVDANVPELWETIAPFGYDVGVAVSMNLPGVGRMLLGVDRTGNLPNSPKAKAQLVSDLQLLATYSQETVARLLVAKEESLTAQQLNVLHLIARGKSSSVIALLLGISDNTVKFHVQGIFRRLHVATREQAVLEGCRLGLIT
jgi:DNA-binding CsgD family transcriptional regulator